jgi:hypothetical protein
MLRHGANVRGRTNVARRSGAPKSVGARKVMNLRCLLQRSAVASKLRALTRRIRRSGAMHAVDRERGHVGAGRFSREWRMKTRNRDAIAQVLMAMAVCILAAIGFDYIIEALTARESGVERAPGHRAAPAVQTGR